LTVVIDLYAPKIWPICSGRKKLELKGKNAKKQQLLTRYGIIILTK